MAAEDIVAAEQYIWLDSDVLVLADPAEHLNLRSGEDFAGCAPDRGSIGSSGPEDRNDEIWHRACDVLGIDIDSLPWVVTCTERLRIRFYLNSGVFAYRRSSGLAQNFAEDCLRYLRAKASKSHPEVHFSDQLVLGLCVHRMGLNWRLLPHSCNYACYSKLLHWVTPGDLASAQILHYHDMMTTKNWPDLVSLIRNAHHPRRDYLEGIGPLHDPSGRMAKGARELLRLVRGLRRRSYYAARGFQK
jgi:lipopolysaccharide biosynthesis glycosyltransferase